MSTKIDRVNLSFHHENEREMKALHYINKRSDATGLSKSEYVINCIIACEEGMVATLTRDDIISIINEAISSTNRKSTGSNLDFGGYT